VDGVCGEPAADVDHRSADQTSKRAARTARTVGQALAPCRVAQLPDALPVCDVD
jgi:hypothetical protein